MTSTAGVTSLAYGFVSAAGNGWSDLTTVVAFVAGVVLLSVFVAVESRVAEPITPLRLFADRGRSSSYVARLFLIAGMFGMFFFLTQFLQDVLSYGPLETGLGFVPFTVALFAMSQLSARRLVERFGGKTLMVGGLTLSTSGMLLLTQLSATSGYLSLLVPLLLFGTGNGLAFVPLTSASLAGVRAEDAGAASGMVNVMQQLGGALGLAVLVSVFGGSSHATAHAVVTAASAAAAHRAFVVGADHAFLAAALFVGATVVVLAVAIPGRRGGARGAEAARRDLAAWVPAMESADAARDGVVS